MGRAEDRAAERARRKQVRKTLPPGMTTEVVDLMNEESVRRFGVRIGELTMQEHRAQIAVAEQAKAVELASLLAKRGAQRELKRLASELALLQRKIDVVAKAVAEKAPEATVALARAAQQR